MVHALQEAHRVLKPNGILIDLRPAPAHRQLGIGEGRSWKFGGQLHEVLEDDYAANAAVARMIREGFFRSETRRPFQLDRVMDTLEDVQDFIAEFDQRRKLPPHTALLKRLERRYRRLTTPGKFTVRGPMHLAILSRLEPKPLTEQVETPMILAILPDASTAESLLNNLSEADFDLKEISVIMKDVELRNKIAKDTGPLKGKQVAELSSALLIAGASQTQAQHCADAVARGKVAVIMNVNPKYEPAAREMFQDMSAELL